MNKELYNFKFWHLLLLIILLYAGTTYVTNTFMFTNSFYYTTLSDKLAIDRITELIFLQHKYQLWGYLFSPILLLLKLWIIAGVVFIGLYLFNQEVSYKNCLKIVVIAELVSVVAMLVRVAWLLIYKPANVADMQYFSPLSITQLFNANTLPKYLFYPIQLFNVFEVAYWLVLAYGIMAFTNFKFGKSLKTVASSYGVALLIWCVIIVFIQLQLS